MSNIPRNARRFTTEMSLGLTPSAGLDGEIHVVIIYVVRPGSRPAHDDPGSPLEVTVYGLQTLHGPVKDLTWIGTTWIEDDEEMRAALVADWADQEQAARDDAADDRRNEARS